MEPDRRHIIAFKRVQKFRSSVSRNSILLRDAGAGVLQ